MSLNATPDPTYSGTWPAAPGTYYIVVRLSAADDASIPDAFAGPVTVTAPPAPDYTATFSAAIPWSGLVGTPINSTGTAQITIQNGSANDGHQSITWAVYLSTDNVLDGSDTLVQQATIGQLDGGSNSTQTFSGNWPAVTGQLYFLIASIQAVDDNNATNNIVIAPHVVAVGTYRYVEGVAESNNAKGPSPTGQISDTGVTSLGAGETIAIEGFIDANKSQYDTYMFITNGTMSRLSMRAMWATGHDDIDLYLWDDGSTNLYSVNVGINAEPGASTFDVTAVTPRNCYVSANSWLENNTSPSAGQKYVILVRGLP
jgi:hypothetical protein